MYKRFIHKVIIICLIIFTVFSNTAFAAMPIADGVDYGPSLIQITRASYRFLSSSFSIGVYLNDGKVFKKGFFSGNPYYNTSHEKIDNNDPNTYRVTYQILEPNGSVINGKSFSNDISNEKVTLDSLGYDEFIAYIAGDGTNNYKAWGSFHY